MIILILKYFKKEWRENKRNGTKHKQLVIKGNINRKSGEVCSVTIVDVNLPKYNKSLEFHRL